MKASYLGGAMLLITTHSVGAVGLDRSGQNIDVLFEPGGYAELSFGRIMPDVDGTDEAVFGGRDSGGIAGDYNQIGLGLKMDIDERLSFAVILDEPYGSDVNYPDTGSVALGGTRAIVDSRAFTALARYRFNDAMSVHGGLRYQTLEADVTLQGAAYGPLSGYNARFGSDDGVGFVIGGAYERPDIALRVALTYSSAIEHDLPTTESIGGIPVNLIDPRLSAVSRTTVETPASINLDFQTGIMADTLLFGNIRYAMYEDTIVSPAFFDGAFPTTSRDSLTDIDNGTSFNLGIGRRFNETLSGSIAMGYEEKGEDLVSPLAPTNGNYSVSVGVAYNINETMTVSGGARYTWLGDAQPETGTPDTARASFTDNNAVAVGMSIAYRF
ncbi:OmpP1/FadL family transporter [Profundibacterium mesophilum]|uniref:Long-chain fatty acid transport protein n=1 Tax=Profundibacterium mesophilum KAUST100406-0324 TaxID=1037889 RepID=A0A921NR44_9RHOB|nr:outer membrane protein transport protein [Profundibacterium mesophilum]KAF0677466.1 Long-chain fatty acid transport protein [Profundibacterium mesophilum KAUST100406-0324]